MWQKAKNQYHLGQAILANLIYMFPSRKLKIIGVTGTDGKTTTASLIYHILISSGYKAALVTSLGAVINDQESDIGYHVTTPGRFVLQSYMRRAIKFGVEYVVVEITSHALDQHRAFGIPIEVGVLTNVSNEHLDYHKTYENYLKTKLKLLNQAKIAVANKDDQSYSKIKNQKSKIKNKKLITYGLNKDSDVNPYNFPFKTKLLGKFNEYNCLAAIAATSSLNIPEDNIRKALLSFKTPVGRQEIVYDKEFCVINDFAHTPNSFKSVLPEVRKITKGRLIHVFGAAAKRDAYKRPEMGKISAEYADIIILTAEDPRGESIDKISDEILSGISNIKFQISNFKDFSNVKNDKKYVYKINDRREAIEFAVSLAEEGDTVLLTGKGHEKSINYGKGEELWNESETARQAVIKSIKGITGTTG